LGLLAPISDYPFVPLFTIPHLGQARGSMWYLYVSPHFLQMKNQSAILLNTASIRYLPFILLAQHRSLVPGVLTLAGTLTATTCGFHFVLYSRVKNQARSVRLPHGRRSARPICDQSAAASPRPWAVPGRACGPGGGEPVISGAGRDGEEAHQPENHCKARPGAGCRSCGVLPTTEAGSCGIAG
jgi:hypothetical protein